MNNLPTAKLGVVAVSRDCFPKSLSQARRDNLTAAYTERYGEIVKIPTVVENEADAMAALDQARASGVNALVIFLGNFGPETPETLMAQRFDGPVMFAAAAEETGEDLFDGRGDAFCGMLNAAYNLKIRGVKAYIPEYPVGTASQVADMIHEFEPVARVLLGVRSLKIITFGPRPTDFVACNAPIKGLYDLGVEIEENSELDLFGAYQAHEGDPRIPAVMEQMRAEVGESRYASVLPRLAQYELTLLDWVETHKGACDYVVMANKCWPSFQTFFKFVPCYVNSRFAARNMPIACEVDVWGALSEYIACCASGKAPTLLDINNTVPADLYQNEIFGKYVYTQKETFMGFHCGNTAACYLQKPELSYQLIMRRTLEPENEEPQISCGTLNGDIIPGRITFFRLQSGADTALHSYVAQGEVLPVPTRSFGGIGIFAIPQMARFYRHVLLEKGYPHHGAVAFAQAGKALFSAVKLLGVEDVDFNRPSGMLYPNENPFA